MPALGAAAQQECRGGQRLADQLLVEEPARGLQACAEHRVGCTAHLKSTIGRFLNERPALLPIDAEWFLSPDVLACAERGHRDVEVSFGNGEVDDELDVWC